MSNRFFLFLTVLLFICALLSRFIFLSSNPPSLNWDEISHGYTAYSLLETGKDQWGQSWPIFNFRAYGDYPTTLYTYLSMPFIKIFGLNAFSIRLPSALLGLGSVFLLGYLVKPLLKTRQVFYLTLLLAATSPFLIFTSRAVYQSTPALFLFLLSLNFFFRPKFFAWGLLPLTLSLFAYHNTRLIAPLILFVFLIFSKNTLNFRRLLLPLSGFFIVTILVFYQLLFGPSSARSRWVGIITPASVNHINNLRNASNLPQPLPRLIYNKPLYFSVTFTKNILSFFNPLPLFLKGSAHYQFNLPNFGLYYPILLPFFYLGLGWYLKNITSPDSRLVLVLFFVSLLPAALTVGDFPSLRLTTALPFYFIFIVRGVSLFFHRFSPKFLRAFYLALFLSYLLFTFRYFVLFPRQYSFAWQDGYSQLVSTLKILYPHYDSIYLTKKYGEPHQFILFYWPISPARYQTDPALNWDYHDSWYWVNAFDKFVFFNDWETPKIDSGSLLVTSSPLSSTSGLQLIHTVTNINHQPVFYLYEP